MCSAAASSDVNVDVTHSGPRPLFLFTKAQRLALSPAPRPVIVLKRPRVRGYAVRGGDQTICMYTCTMHQLPHALHDVDKAAGSETNTLNTALIAR